MNLEGRSVWRGEGPRTAGLDPVFQAETLGALAADGHRDPGKYLLDALLQTKTHTRAVDVHIELNIFTVGCRYDGGNMRTMPFGSNKDAQTFMHQSPPANHLFMIKNIFQ